MLIAFDDLKLKDLKYNLDNFILTMAENGFIDHGFYSAILVLLVYGNLIQNEYKYENQTDYSLFFFPVVDSASAILLHNYYRNVLLKSEKNEKKPLSRGQLNVKEHPLGYLLILCDELQEWSRKAFGILDKKRFHVDDCDLVIGENSLEITYLFNSGLVKKDFTKEKEELINNVLKVDDVFSEGIVITPRNENVDPLLINNTLDLQIPNQLIRTIEAIAKQIYYFHRKDNKNFEKLEDNVKYYYFKRAEALNPELNSIGYEIVHNDDKRKGLAECSDHKFPSNELNILVESQRNNMFKQTKNIFSNYFQKNHFNWKNISIHSSIMEALFFTDYFMCWEHLIVEIQGLDKKFLENIHSVLKKIDLKIVRTYLRMIAIKNHDFYNKEVKKNKKFSDLPPVLQYSNYNLAYVFPSLLKSTMGYEITSIKDKRKKVTKFSDEEEEILAKSFHEIWLFEVKSDGWTYGDETLYDEQTMRKNKMNKHILPWEKLDDDMKEINKKTVRQWPIFFEEMDLQIVES